MTVPTTSWSETTPEGSESRALGDDRIRELKTQLREVIAADHIMAFSGQSATTGYHNKVTLVEQSSSPTMVDNTFMFYAKEADSKSELYMDTYNATRTEQQLTENGNWIGGIQYEVRMFSGLTANIPTGWLICDGNNDTPNLTDKFIRGVATITVRPNGGTGGANTVTLTTTQLPAHTHTGTTGNNSVVHVHTTVGYDTIGGGGAETGMRSTTIGLLASQRLINTLQNGVSHTHTITTGSTGTGAAFAILPGYTALAFIMKS